jgi:hypothetical protein
MTDTTPADDLPARLEAVLTERFTELGNPFSRMRREEKGPDGWPAEHPVGPHHVAEVLRELLAAVTVPASAPTDQAALRSDLEDALKGAGVYDSKERMWHSLSPEWIEEILTEVLAVLPAPADRAAILRAEAEHLIRDLYPAVYDDAGQKTALGVNRAARELLDRADAAELRRMADAASGPGGVAGETPQPDPAAPELTAEEARALVDQMGLDLYRAQDAIEFARECCDIADREQRPVTTADVREWLKGDRCTRQRAADEAQQPETQADTALRIRVLSEILGRLTGSQDGDSATDDVPAATVRRVLAEILTGMQPGSVRGRDAERPAAVSQPDEEA